MDVYGARGRQWSFGHCAILRLGRSARDMLSKAWYWSRLRARMPEMKGLIEDVSLVSFIFNERESHRRKDEEEKA